MLNIYNPNNHDTDKTADMAPASGGKNGAKKPDFTKYQDPTQEFSSQELKYGMWYVRHKALLYKILVGGLAAVDAVFVIFGLWKWGEYLLGWQNHARLQRNLTIFVNYTGIHPRYGALPVQVAEVRVFPSRENKFDVVAELANANTRFLVKFNYYFLIGGTKTPTQKTFLLPGESRPVAVLGVKDGLAAAPNIVLENVEYKRISAHEVTDAKTWQEYRLNFRASDFVFLKSLEQEGQNTDAVKFNLTNDSPYGYVAPDFYVGLLQNGQMVGILPLHLDSIKSLETKPVDLRNFVPGLNITDISLYPLINVYDEEAYSR